MNTEGGISLEPITIGKKKRKVKDSKRMRKQKRNSTIFLAPSVLGVALFFVIPFLVVIYYSMVDNPISLNFVFLDNFKNVIRNNAFKKAVRNTFSFSAIAVPLAVVLSLLLAVLLDSKIPFKSQFRTFFLSPMMVPVASVVLIWQVLFHYNGVINEITGWNIFSKTFNINRNLVTSHIFFLHNFHNLLLMQ